jgi:Family of unknown function (DUF5343)
MADAGSFPKISEASWWKIRELFKKSLPSIANVKYFSINLGMNELSARTNIMPALVQCGIIDEQGKPTSRANLWRDDDHYAEVCGQIVKDTYPEELLDICPGPTPDRDKVFKWFATTKSLGESAAQKLSATYMLLISGEIRKDTAKNGKTNTSIKSASQSKIKSQMPKEVTKAVSENSKSLELPKIQHTSTKMPSVHIDLQIHISADTTPELVDKIFESIRKHLYTNE